MERFRAGTGCTAFLVFLAACSQGGPDFKGGPGVSRGEAPKAAEDSLQAPAVPGTTTESAAAASEDEVVSVIRSQTNAEQCATSHAWRLQRSRTGPEVGLGLSLPCDSAVPSKIPEYSQNPEGADLLATVSAHLQSVQGSCGFPAGFLTRLAREKLFSCGMVGLATNLNYSAPGSCVMWLMERVQSASACAAKCAALRNFGGGMPGSDVAAARCQFVEQNVEFLVAPVSSTSPK